MANTQTTAISRHPDPGHTDPRRFPWLEIVAGLYFLFIIYGSLLPFDFALDAPQTDHPLFLTIPVTDIGLPDAASNIALYVPLGFLLYALLRRRKVSAISTFTIVLLLTAALSMTIESMQKISISRIASIADVLCNIIGTVIGMILYVLESRLIRRFVPALEHDLAHQPATALVGACALILAVAALAPLDLAFDVSLIANAVRNAHFLPLEKHNELVVLANQAHGLQSVGSNHRYLVDLWQLRLDYIADIVSFTLLGALISFQLRLTSRTPEIAAFKASAAVAAYAILITGAGLFVVSVGFDSTHILTRAVGGLLGVALYPIMARTLLSDRAADPQRTAHRRRRILLTCLVLTATYITARQLAPFTFDPQDAAISQATTEWMPLHGYYLSKIPQAALDALQKSLRYIAFGGLLTGFWLASGKLLNLKRWAITTLATGTAITILEAAQFWLPGRYPAVTDIIIATTMTTVGLLAGKRFYQWYTATTALHTAAVRTTPPLLFNVELPPPADHAATKPTYQEPQKHHIKPPQR